MLLDRKRWVAGAAAAVVMVVAAACGGSEQASTDAPSEKGAKELGIDLSGTKIRMTSPEAATLQMGQYLLADQLREWGAEVDLITLTTTTGVQALIANQADVAPHGADETILAAAEGAPIVGVGVPESKMNYLLVANKSIESIEDLEGSTIGMSGPAGFDALLTRLTLEDEGLAESDAKFVQIGGSPDRAAALLAGQIDAATIFADNWIELERKTEDLVVLREMAEFFPALPGSVYMGLRHYWNENPDIALAVACGNLEINQFINEEKDQFIDYTLENVRGAEEGAVEESYQFAMDVDMFPTDPEALFNVGGLDALQKAMLESGDISKSVNVEKLVDMRYVEKAFDMGCGQ